MGRETGIEWTDATWNPIRGCSRVSEGCRNCYAEAVAARFSGPGRPYAGLASFVTLGKGTLQERVVPQWTGEVRLIEEHVRDPLKWKDPLRIFVNSMSDLFHPGVREEWLAEIFEVMAKAPQHTYQILTKRPERMLEAMQTAADPDLMQSFQSIYRQPWPPPNWIFGVSIEDQESANYRLPILARCPVAQRMVSYEPAIGPVDFAAAMGGDPRAVLAFDWIIVGGESGPRARPMHPDWPRSVRDLCSELGIPFFFKQWGEWMPRDPQNQKEAARAAQLESGVIMSRVGKHDAGAVIDGMQWRQFPEC
jgi:protein gp37